MVPVVAAATIKILTATAAAVVPEDSVFEIKKSAVPRFVLFWKIRCGRADTEIRACKSGK